MRYARKSLCTKSLQARCLFLLLPMKLLVVLLLGS